MEGGVIIREEEDWLGGDSSFEGIEGVLLQCFSVPCTVLKGEVKQQMRMMREALDEPLIEVDEA